MGLDLYAKIEPLLGFEQEKEKLYRIFLKKLRGLGVRSVLDIGCGSGVFMDLAKKEGFRIIGIDLSEEMVRRAQNKGLECECKDVCEIKEEFDAAVAVFDVLNYLSSSELKKFLRCVHAILKDGGYLIADINTLVGFEEVAQGSLWIDADNEFVAIEGVFENKKLKTDIIYFYKKNGCFFKERDQIVQYYHEVDRLKIEGLKIVEIDFISLFGEDSDKALLVYKRM